MKQEPRSVGNTVAELLRAHGIHVQQRRVPGAAQPPANLHQLLNFPETWVSLFIKGNKNIYSNWHESVLVSTCPSVLSAITPHPPSRRPRLCTTQTPVFCRVIHL